MVIFYSVLTLSLLGLTSGGVLAFAAKKFSVTVDPKVEQLTAILPGANCGACGYASCHELAKALLRGEAASNACIAGAREVAGKVAEFLGHEDESSKIAPLIAVVQCRGGRDKAKDKFIYKGINDCKAALLVGGGFKACEYGCLGLGNCVRVCPFNAIVMGEDGIPIIDDARCTACGKCVKACPRAIIKLILQKQKVYLGCISKDKGKKVREVCTVGCIACGICVKPEITPSGLIIIEDNLPIIHWEEGKDLNKMLEQTVKKCPNKCFVTRGE